MKKLLAVMALLGVLQAAFAVYPDAEAPELTGVKWVSGSPMSTAPVKARKSAKRDPLARGTSAEYRALVFILCRANGSEMLIQQLDSIKRQYGEHLRIALITPDPEADAAAFVKRHSDISLNVAVDTRREITAKYMAGSMLYPMAFLIDNSGKVIWRGESIDLEENLQKALSGKNDPGQEAKIARLTEELAASLRDNKEREQRRIADDIFSLDPANAAALRMRLFSLENTRRIPEARQLISRRLAAAPEVARLYFTWLDFAANFGWEKEDFVRIVTQFSEKITAANKRAVFAFMLLQNFPYNPEALKRADTLLSNDDALRSGDPEELAARSLLAYRLGNVKKALKLREAASAALKQSGNEVAYQQSVEIERFFKTILELNKSAKRK